MLTIPERNMKSSLLLCIVAFFATSSAFTTTKTIPSLQRSDHASPLFYSRDDHLDHPEAAQPLPLTKKDLDRMFELKNRQMTIPIVIMHSLLPGQRLFFQSADPKFEEMLKHVLGSGNSNEIGIVGFNPHTGLPLNMGVTSPVLQKDITFGINKKSERVMATSFKGGRRFVVVGEPWMDETQSFYLANVEVVDEREEMLPEELERNAEIINKTIPGLVDTWVEWVISSETATPAVVIDMLKEIGRMPSTFKERAIWVAALVNPVVPIDVCPEIRPAMMACRNDHDRLVLASTALQSSIDHMSGKRRLF